MVKIFSLIGNAGSGKSTYAKKIEKQYENTKTEVFKLSLAEPLKELLNNYVEGKSVWNDADKREYYRTHLQLVGDKVREYDLDFFVKIMAHKIVALTKDLVDDCIVIIDDVRYENEFYNFEKILISLGLQHKTEVVYLKGNHSTEKVSNHPSEQTEKVIKYIKGLLVNGTLGLKDIVEVREIDG